MAKIPLYVDASFNFENYNSKLPRGVFEVDFELLQYLTKLQENGIEVKFEFKKVVTVYKKELLTARLVFTPALPKSLMPENIAPGINSIDNLEI